MRNYDKEAVWEKATYKKFFYRARRDNGDVEMLEIALNGKSFTEWVKQHITEDLENDR